ncbi:Ubiquitin-specific protease family C19-related protein [Striga hermonthica]|uniref:Ubiquitin-specific protease family C19-related protein n=1 Tax=Striga hermonthica TaxID=68872 RepID=A0A9N7NGW6_STRHE|nr:Ubiquitin-specific protease family C19-related protein [Striga hermonthica]
MGTSFPSHQLSNGLYVSGLPEQPKEKTSTKCSVAVPYTGGDSKKSGELSKMFVIPPDGSKSRKTGTMIQSGSAARASYSTPGPVSSMGISGALASMKKPHSGPLSKHGEPIKKYSGPQSGAVTPVNLPTTGLITSGPISSGPLNHSGALRNASGSMKLHGSSVGNNLAVTTIGRENISHSFMKNLPRPILWGIVMLFMMGFIAGGFILGAVNNAILLDVLVVLFCLAVVLLVWNLCWARKAVVGYIADYPDSELRAATNGQFVKVTGVVACSNVPLKSSFQKFPRCVFTSSSLYEYRGWGSKWALRFSEKHAVDFYISDFQSGLRALVKAGYGARVIPYVDESVAIDVDPSKNDTPPEFIHWLGERNLSLEDRLMRLKEGSIKEGSTVSVMGIVQRTENVLMIVPPNEPFTTGCQWAKCTLPASFDGLVLWSDDESDMNVIPV